VAHISAMLMINDTVNVAPTATPRIERIALLTTGIPFICTPQSAAIRHAVIGPSSHGSGRPSRIKINTPNPATPWVINSRIIRV